MISVSGSFMNLTMNCVFVLDCCFIERAGKATVFLSYVSCHFSLNADIVCGPVDAELGLDFIVSIVYPQCTIGFNFH